MRHKAALVSMLGAALFIAGICLRGVTVSSVPLVLAGAGAVTCVAGLVWLLTGRHQTRCPSCGAIINTGPSMYNLRELSKSRTLKCPSCGAIVHSGK